ncbi:hypothetical protein [Microcella humidisoli]|uniref:Uncharacterized protein n=1 Tax=Microcella humidisoli TaxID=2963406 RepID=A0ABY5FWS5_9MICO|nr:hypothetical protein [Microcella humidisoli]UTT62591.1 hypothetical protein NNL39_00260 [Microcella humidisoli]
MSKKREVELARRSFSRIRLIHEELDRLGADASARHSSIMSKGSFLAVAAGVVIAATSSRLWEVQPIVGLAALVLACLALVGSALALRPGQRIELLPQRLADKYVDSQLTAATVERQLVLDKAHVLVAREGDLKNRSLLVSTGFVLLILSTTALCITFSFETLGGT